MLFAVIRLIQPALPCRALFTYFVTSKPRVPLRKCLPSFHRNEKVQRKERKGKKMRHGGQILVDQLKLHDVKRVFSVPGESFLAALDGLYESGIENVVCRHEGGAAMMADAMGKMTGKPGIAFVTRGPGATNASSGVHVAMQDSTPMILFVGQIARGHRDREAFQEVDYRAMFGPLAKWVTEIDQVERLPEYINRAFHIATSGRPGPVVLALPEDMLSSRSDTPALKPTAKPVSSVSERTIDAVLAELKQSKRPLVVAGGGGWCVESSQALTTFASANNLPVVTPFRRNDIIDNRLPNYCGDLGVGMNPKLAEHLKSADLLLVIGARLGDIMTGAYELVDPANPGKTIIHVHPDPGMPGTVYRTDIAITATSKTFVDQLSKTQSVGDWSDWTAQAKADAQTWKEPVETPGDVKLEQVVHWLSENLPDDAIVTNGAGNYAAFVHRYFNYKGPGTQVSPTSGSMGYGFPAAVAASLQHPERQVVCFAGDGCFQMTLNEMSTAMQHGAKPIVVVANNGRYGTIRMHQERHYPGRVSGTDMANPNFAALSEAYGGFGRVVHRTEDFVKAFEQARSAGTLAVIELRLDPEMLSTSKTVSETRGS